MEMDIEKGKKLLNAEVLFSEGDTLDEIGTITDVWLQPSIDLKNKPDKVIYLSDDEIPDKDGNYPKSKTSPKILFQVLFKGYVRIMESDHFTLVETN